MTVENNMILFMPVFIASLLFLGLLQLNVEPEIKSYPLPKYSDNIVFDDSVIYFTESEYDVSDKSFNKVVKLYG